MNELINIKVIQKDFNAIRSKIATIQLCMVVFFNINWK